MNTPAAQRTLRAQRRAAEAKAVRSVVSRAGRANRPRVLHVISGLGPGGAETVLYRLTTGSRRFEHQVICLGPPDWYSNLLEDRGVRVYHLDCTSIRTVLANAGKLHRIVRRSHADLVQGWMYRGNLLGGLSGRLLGKPVVWNIRCSDAAPLRRASRVLARVGGFLARWVPDLIINCSAQSLALHSQLGYEAAECALIPNGYDPDLFTPDEISRAAARAALGMESNSFLVGSIGRWHPQKGFPILLRAIRLLCDRNIPVRVVLAGRGLDSQNPELSREIDESRCGGLVVPIGYRSDVPQIARALDLHVLASVGAEGFPNIVAETMLSGAPNVATRIGESAAIVGDTGWIVPPDQPEAIADAIEEAYWEWSRRPAEWEDRRTKARHRIRENFTLTAMIRAYEDVWTRFTPSVGNPAKVRAG